MHLYLAHGLVLASSLPIPALLPAEGDVVPDVTIHFVDDLPADAGADGPSIWFESPILTPAGVPALRATRHRAPAAYRLAFTGGPLVAFDAPASTVWVSVPAGQTPADTWSYLLGPALGIVLRLRGIVCLHASAVVIDGEAVAFVGPQGSGKSTLAAAFADAGREVLSDDTVALRPRAGRWFAAPGYPRIRLWPDAVDALRTSGSGIAAAAPATASERQHVDLMAMGRFGRAPAPLAAIYFLEFAEPDAQPRIDPGAGAETVIDLVANTFAGRVLDRDRRGREFDAVIALASAVRMRRLRRPPDLPALRAVCAAIEQDCARAVAGATVAGEPQ